jgi:hypothetical protein
MSRVIFHGYASDDCGETVVPAEIEALVEPGYVVDVDRVRRIVRIQMPQDAELPETGHELKVSFNRRVVG